MKIKTLVVASALAATGVIGAVSQSASAGCGVSITVDNDLDRDVTVNWALSKVRISTWGAPWSTLGNYSTVVDPQSDDTNSDQETRAFNLNLGCNLNRRYKLYVSDSEGGSFYEYGPSSTGWTKDVTPFIRLNG